MGSSGQACFGYRRRSSFLTSGYPFFQKLAGFAVASAASVYGKTIDWRAVYFDPTLDTVHPLHSGRYICFLWHECMFMPLLLRGSRKFVALTSEHRDGEFLTRAGQLSVDAEGDWLLRVEPRTVDILLDQLPWGISMIKLPWMSRLMRVEWR